MEIFRWVQKLSHLYKEEELMMKKLISLRTQKIIMFIPVINIFVLFIWLYNYSKFPSNSKIFIKSLLYVFAVFIPMGIIHSILFNILSEYKIATTILNFIVIYYIPLAVGYVLIKYQEKTIFKK